MFHLQIWTHIWKVSITCVYIIQLLKDNLFNRDVLVQISYVTLGKKYSSYKHLLICIDSREGIIHSRNINYLSVYL